MENHQSPAGDTSSATTATSTADMDTLQQSPSAPAAPMSIQTRQKADDHGPTADHAMVVCLQSPSPTKQLSAGVMSTTNKAPHHAASREQSLLTARAAGQPLTISFVENDATASHPWQQQSPPVQHEQQQHMDHPEKAASFRQYSRAEPSLTQQPQTSVRFVLALTRDLLTTYQRCNSQLQYSLNSNPRRVLTKPSVPVKNDGFDNEDSDYILYVNDILGDKEGSRFVILDVLGSGTFGQVVKCRNLKTNQVSAIKVIKNKPAYFKQSMMEVTILELLNSRYDTHDQHHIARMLEVFVFRKHLCLVFELLSVNLYELIKQNHFRGLSTNLVRAFTTQILDALTVLSEARLIHCDLKPENILLKSLESPTIKVIDFGSACHEQQTVYTYIQSRFYRSPEVLLGLPYSSSIDMWSVGCITIELFLGLPIFPGSSEFNQVCRMVETLGLPPTYMLEFGKNSRNFFDRIVDTDDKVTWHLKSLDSYNKEKGAQEQPSKRYFQTHNLKELILNYPMSSKKSSVPAEAQREMNIRMSLLDFVCGLLNMNPLERWSPQQARMHPFITGQPYLGPFTPPMEFKPRRHVAQQTSQRSRDQLAHPMLARMDTTSASSFDSAAGSGHHRRPRATTISSAKLASIPSQLQQAAAANTGMTKYPSQSSRKPSISSFTGPPPPALADYYYSSSNPTSPAALSPNSMNNRSPNNSTSLGTSRRSSPHSPLRASPLLETRIASDLDNMTILQQQQQAAASASTRHYTATERSQKSFQPERPLLPVGHMPYSFQRKNRSHSVSDRGGHTGLWLTMGGGPPAASAPVSPTTNIGPSGSGSTNSSAYSFGAAYSVSPTGGGHTVHQSQYQHHQQPVHQQQAIQGFDLRHHGGHAQMQHQQQHHHPQAPDLSYSSNLPLSGRHAISLSSLSQIREHPTTSGQASWQAAGHHQASGGQQISPQSFMVPGQQQQRRQHQQQAWSQQQQQQPGNMHQLSRRQSAPVLNVNGSMDPSSQAYGMYARHSDRPSGEYTMNGRGTNVPDQQWTPAGQMPSGLSPPLAGYRPIQPSGLAHSYIPTGTSQPPLSSQAGSAGSASPRVAASTSTATSKLNPNAPRVD